MTSSSDSPPVSRRRRLGRTALDQREVLRALPGLARTAGSTAVHVVGWGVRTSVHTGVWVVRSAPDAVAAVELVREAATAAAAVGGLARSAISHVPVPGSLRHSGESSEHPPVEPTTPRSLRERGGELLERSRDAWSNEQGHPAYARILDELAPDEGRILLHLLQDGPQPAVDVRTGGRAAMGGSHLLAPGLSMIAVRAEVRYAEQVPAYLDNLFRLGLVWFSKEPLRDAQEYHVLEAQPDVSAALHSTKFAKLVRRSIHLTPFGEGFCRACLVSEGEVGVADFPEHAEPGEAEAAVPPTV